MAKTHVFPTVFRTKEKIFADLFFVKRVFSKITVRGTGIGFIKRESWMMCHQSNLECLLTPAVPAGEAAARPSCGPCTRPEAEAQLLQLCRSLVLNQISLF